MFNLDRARPDELIGAAAMISGPTPGLNVSRPNERITKMTMDNRTRWLALIILCLGDLMIVLDTTIVNVALPSIREDLGFSQTSLAWVVNAYLLTFGGFLLLGGRLGDLFGHRRLFLFGIALFTLASLACGLSTSQGLLDRRRAPCRGSAAPSSPPSRFSLIMILFTEPAERAKAMGVFGFVAVRRRHDRRAARRRPDRTRSTGTGSSSSTSRSASLVVALSLRLLPAARGSARCGPAPRRRRRGHGDGVADARRLRDRQRQPGRAGRPAQTLGLLGAAVGAARASSSRSSRASPRR